MGFMDAVKSCLSKYATFRGRASRSEFWFFTLFYLLAAFAAAVLDGVFGGMAVFGTLLAFGMLLPNLAVSVRRLHDLDRSGWWILLYLVPLVGLIFYLIWNCSRGTAGPNRFGDDPLGGEALALPA